MATTVQGLRRVSKRCDVLNERVADGSHDEKEVAAQVQAIISKTVGSAPEGFDLVWVDVFEDDLHGGEYIQLVCSYKHGIVLQGRLRERPQLDPQKGWVYRIFAVQDAKCSHRSTTTSLCVVWQDASAKGKLPEVLTVVPNDHWQPPKV